MTADEMAAAAERVVASLPPLTDEQRTAAVRILAQARPPAGTVKAASPRTVVRRAA